MRANRFPLRFRFPFQSLLALIALAMADAGARWQRLPSLDIFGMSAFQDAGRGMVYAVTESGGFHASGDTGRTWTKRGSIPVGTERPTHVAFTSPDTGYACGRLATIWRTANGGRDWARVFSDFLVPWQRFEFFPGSQAGLALNQLFLVRTGDGWTTPVILRRDVDDMRILGPGRAMLLAGDTLYVSRDTGRTWQPLPWSPPANGTVRCFGFTDPRSGYLLVETPGGPANAGAFTLYRTGDSGTSWSPMPRGAQGAGRDPAPPYAQAVFSDSARGLSWDLVLEDDGLPRLVMVRTQDGGRTWTPADPRKLAWSEPDFSVGPGGTFWMMEGAGGLSRSRNDGMDWERLSGGAPRIYGPAWFQDRNRGVAIAGVGDGSALEGTVFRTRDGGRTWRMHAGLADIQVRNMHFADTRHGYAVGDSGQVLKSSDSGDTWTPVPFPFRSNLLQVFFCDSAAGLVGTLDSAFLTIDAGKTWRLVRTIAFADGWLDYIALADARRLFIYGDRDGHFWMSPDGGATWRETLRPSGHADIRGMAFPAPGICYAVTLTGEFLASQDSGLTWEKRTTVPGPFLPSSLSLSFSAPDTGFAYGTAGILYGTTDGGRTWIDYRLPVTDEEWVVWTAPVSGPPTWALTSDGATWEYSPTSSRYRPATRFPLSPSPFALRNGNLVVRLDGDYSLHLIAWDAGGRRLWTGSRLQGKGETIFPLPARSRVAFLEITGRNFRHILKAGP